ncbi:uncharacterized protein BO88DRAFT_480193 [Aspergillus vadensis CBS 113365]|uniref:Uncharacterized protein n=1 Tax=Aspergillus vadensis (strain CBS 113365 / IMI 142717 / IBT 24658) TaxID=1448311 RepID=A0A319BCK2_ASPVC|nr:hypothetical protein BO88DRAFT_480193 [Aspergillus vadensis CBS 113365]PYH70826.1 hypothetical protein BO88DRAFT_480193 [Aspergillus vadensis CBS 113365]
MATDEAMERSTERAASPTALDQAPPASDGISHTLGSIRNGNQDDQYPSLRVVSNPRPIEFEQTVASTVSAKPRQFRSRYSLGNTLESVRQWRAKREQEYIRQMQAFAYVPSDSQLPDIERLISLNRPLEGEPTYQYAGADTVQAEPCVRRPDHQLSSGLVGYMTKSPELSGLGSHQDTVISRHLDGYSKQKDSLLTRPSPTPSLLSKTYHGTLTILSRIGLRESETRRGYTRIRWKNGRDKWLYDDYVEHVPGALEDMKAFLRSSAYVTTADMNGGSQQVTTSSTSSCNSTSSASQMQHSPSSRFTNQLQGSNIIPTSDSQTDVELGEMVSHPPLLLSCLEKSRYAVELRQKSIIGVADDRQLFYTLRRIYHEHRGRLRPIWSLKTLHSIHFMKFAYGGSRYIDVRCHEEICETGRPCVCVPPEQLVLPKGKEYDCRPVPPKLSPPIGPRLMMDFFNNPQYIAPNSTLIVQQLPKRACGKLQNEYINPTEAWGIFYKEDWNWAKIWWILALGFFPPSLLFGVLWTVFKQDISGAFGVASWWMAGASIIVGIVGTYDM